MQFVDAGADPLTVDFVCDATMPRTAGSWVALAALRRSTGTTAGGSYFVSIRSAFGCPIQLSKKELPTAHKAPDEDGSDIIEWVSSGERKVGWRYELGPVYDKHFEFEAPQGNGFVELALKANLPCGSARQRGIVGCLHLNGVAPEVTGLRTQITVWRASADGVHLKFRRWRSMPRFVHMQTCRVHNLRDCNTTHFHVVHLRGCCWCKMSHVAGAALWRLRASSPNAC